MVTSQLSMVNFRKMINETFICHGCYGDNRHLIFSSSTFTLTLYFPPCSPNVESFGPSNMQRGCTLYCVYGTIRLMSGGLFVCLFGFLTSSSTTRLYPGRASRQERLTILRAATHETELGDHDFFLSRSHYTDTDPTCRERAATAGIEPGTSSPGVARSTAELPPPPLFTVYRGPLDS